MRYEIHNEKGDVLASSETWQGIMESYNPCRKASETHISIVKIEDEEE